jgi:hypothetical protein
MINKFFVASAIILALAFLFACRINHKTVTSSGVGGDSISKITFTYSFPLVKTDGEKKAFTDSISIFYYKHYRIYQTHYTKSIESDTSLLLMETKYKYFCFEKGASVGYWFDSLSDATGRRANVDSFLIQKANSRMDLNLAKHDIFFSKHVTPNGITAIVYAANSIPDISYPDTTIHYFADTLQGVEYSLAPQNDTIKNARLFKIRLIYNAQEYKDQRGLMMPAREFLFEVMPRTVNDPKFLMQLAERTKEYYKEMGVVNQIH